MEEINKGIIGYWEVNRILCIKSYAHSYFHLIDATLPTKFSIIDVVFIPKKRIMLILTT